MPFRRFLIVCSLCLMLPIDASAETRAVLVGVSAYQHLSEAQQLWASGHDVAEMRDLLIRRGVKSGNIKILTDPGKAWDRPERDKLPTRQHIMDALTALKENSKPGDFAIVYLSGHGSFQNQLGDGSPRNKGDGRDKVFLPSDVEISSDGSATVIKNGIVDREIGAFQAAIRDKGVDLWFTLDSCYSGSGLRAAGQARFKFIDPAELGVRVAATSSPRAVVNFGDLEPTEAPAGTTRRGRAAFLYASQADERAAELPLPLSVSRKNQTWRSAFTHAMVMALMRQPELTYREVVDYANGLMREFGGHEIRQTAGQDGNLVKDRVVGAGASDGSPEQWAVHGDRLEAGILHGVETGAIVSLFADPTAPDNRPRGYAEVKRATATESQLVPLREYPCPFVTGNPQCRTGGSDVLAGVRYARFVAPPRDYRLAVSSPRATAAAPERLVLTAKEVYHAIRTDNEQKDVLARLGFDDDKPDLIWWVTHEGFRLLPPGVDPILLQTGAGMRVDASMAPAVVIPTMVRLLLRAYRVERLRRLAAEPGRAGAAIALSVTARTASDAIPQKCPAGAGAPVRGANAVLRAQPCSVVGARIENSAAVPRYINVFTIDSDWKIRRKCTQGGDESGTGALYAAHGSRNCTILKYLNAGERNDPNIPDVARFELLVLSTPRVEGVGPPTFDSIENLNDTEGTTRSALSALEFDDALTGGGFLRGAGDRAPPSVTIVGWELDASGRK